MKPPAPRELLDQAAHWDELHRWERSELGRALRRLGWTYSEIRELIPVPKGTLSGWCRDVRLTPGQITAIKDRGYPREVPRGTQGRRRREIERIREEASAEAHHLIKEPLWVLGTALYWGEGSKTTRRLQLTNTDPAVLRIFIQWVRRFLRSDPDWTLAMHLHHGNNEDHAKRYWRDELGLPDSRFTKTFIKPPGTGHRKNKLPWGICRVTLARSTDEWIRVMAWIASLPRAVGVDNASTLWAGR